MKLKLLVHSMALLTGAASQMGCVGYNTALFMTKSNAGLDLDVKPPTAEINISRKEGVVEPSFEGGKTPPVMASFSARTSGGGGDSLKRFLFGVDQTFSGGDAAVTMAKLYVSDRVPTAQDLETKPFDSGIELSKPPQANSPNAKKAWFGIKKALFALPEPGEVRPFFFGTDTQLGVKVGWNGVGGPYPDTVKIGFNRKEIAIAPVTLTPSEDSTSGKLRTNVVRIPSFLATVETDVQGSESVQISWMQYFATGASATSLALQPGVRKAMAIRSDPQAAAQAGAQRAGADKALADQQRVEEIVDYAQKDKDSLDVEKVTTLVAKTALKVDEVKTLKPDQFRAKLKKSWSLYIGSLYNNIPND